MLFLRNHLFVAVAMAAVLFNACADDSSPSPIIEEPDPIAPSKVSTTAFTATLTAQYNGVSKVDIALGKSGILYCLKTDNVYYINADFLLEQKPDLFEPDGMHPVSTFYPRWLTYIADVTGLSGTT